MTVYPMQVESIPQSLEVCERSPRAKHQDTRVNQPVRPQPNLALLELEEFAVLCLLTLVHCDQIITSSDWSFYFICMPVRMNKLDCCGPNLQRYQSDEKKKPTADEASLAKRSDAHGCGHMFSSQHNATSLTSRSSGGFTRRFESVNVGGLGPEDETVNTSSHISAPGCSDSAVCGTRDRQLTAGPLLRFRGHTRLHARPKEILGFDNGRRLFQLAPSGHSSNCTVESIFFSFI